MKKKLKMDLALSWLPHNYTYQGAQFAKTDHDTLSVKKTLDIIMARSVCHTYTSGVTPFANKQHDTQSVSEKDTQNWYGIQFANIENDTLSLKRTLKMDVALSLPPLIHPKALSLPIKNMTLSLFPQQFVLPYTF